MDTGDKKSLWNNHRSLKQLGEEISASYHIFNTSETQFAQESKTHRRKIRSRWILSACVMALVFFILFSVASAARTTAKANRLAAQAQQNIEDDSVTAMCQIYEAASLHVNKNIEQVLCDAAVTAFERPFSTVEMSHDRPVSQALFYPGGEHILTVSNDKTAKLWDLNGRMIREMGFWGGTLKRSERNLTL